MILSAHKLRGNDLASWRLPISRTIVTILTILTILSVSQGFQATIGIQATVSRSIVTILTITRFAMRPCAICMRAILG
jgi:hypothetical protein